MNKAISLLVVFALLESGFAALTYKDIFIQEWQTFKAKFGKTYPDTPSEEFRMKIFMENTHKIAAHNERASKGEKNYHLAMNHFGDFLHHEFVALVNGYKKELKKFNGSHYISPKHTVIPKSVDWRTEGAVTPVKNQGQCGSCWSFSSTGALEGQHFRKTGKLVSLSEQNLIDCSTPFGNNGCNGGLMDNAFSYIKSNDGIDTEQSYPYEAKDDRCRFKRSDVGADDTGFVDIPSGNEEKLAEALANIGPISVAIDASHESFQFYSHGIYDEPECSSTELDHGVLAVGYGEQKTFFNTKRYWLIKNSWGEGWGDKGYIKIVRGENNRCGVATQASYPLV